MSSKNLKKAATMLSPAYAVTQAAKGGETYGLIGQLAKLKKDKKKKTNVTAGVSKPATTVKMKAGGQVNCRGMGAATRGGRFHKDG